jgi:hypothetical protein
MQQHDFDEGELRARIERQRIVISEQAEILESLGFDTNDVADCLERVQAPPKGRLRSLLVGAIVNSLK